MLIVAKKKRKKKMHGQFNKINGMSSVELAWLPLCVSDGVGCNIDVDDENNENNVHVGKACIHHR